VFVQFAREVDGGNIQRLVFRDAALPVGKRRVFGTTTGSATDHRVPIVVHVAHDALFVVTVTESIPAAASDLYRSESQDATISAFAHAVLGHVASQEDDFLKAIRRQDVGRKDSPGRPALLPSRPPPQIADAPVTFSGDDTERARQTIPQQATYVSSNSATSLTSHESSDSLSEDNSPLSSDAGTSKSSVGTPLMPFDVAQIAQQVNHLRAQHQL
jgi:hypothetical protein